MQLYIQTVPDNHSQELYFLFNSTSRKAWRFIAAYRFAQKTISLALIWSKGSQH